MQLCVSELVYARVCRLFGAIKAIIISLDQHISMKFDFSFNFQTCVFVKTFGNVMYKMSAILFRHWWNKGTNDMNTLSRAIAIVFPDKKVHGANMGPTWVLSAPDGPHVGPMNLAIKANYGLMISTLMGSTTISEGHSGQIHKRERAELFLRKYKYSLAYCVVSPHSNVTDSGNGTLWITWTQLS